MFKVSFLIFETTQNNKSTETERPRKLLSFESSTEFRYVFMSFATSSKSWPALTRRTDLRKLRPSFERQIKLLSFESSTEFRYVFMSFAICKELEKKMKRTGSSDDLSRILLAL